MVAVAMAVVVGPSPGDAHSTGVPASPPASDGADLYGRDCSFCHGVEGEGTRQGPSITDTGEAGARYVLVSGRMPIDHPDALIERGPSAYEPEEIDDLVDHVAGLGDGPELPALDLEDADLVEGGRLYRLHCAACHSSTGIGGSLAYDQLSPPLSESEPEVVAGAVLVGPGAMPAFAPGELDDQQVASVAAHVAYLQDPPDPGGFPLGRTGRLGEGLAAWVIGVGALLAAAALIARPHRIARRQGQARS
ncbi:c-type cytochrome [soil metagenome]